ncbi:MULTISPECIES: flagellar hook assembly protein FlgD [unclassified Pseudodesulfovibrio]|uniref:flagellar hook assembly protein FlgD n=1 Tax=unclassified Pseudodesulfovibrio TaxID=2661612 RepID=UPI000FEBBEE8|nr:MULTISPECIES: flagellar hook assembly protein FlgD [unclassified Pseudodesulfovibrio]MCJ2166253.1 flagellar hook assembly protein FlgD [Pseudodesulfovibrio sp. S3-i]RWU02285.1 flagellar hook assembly protein FlgD [Pseudodesulfovibrio sp. S3]
MGYVDTTGVYLGAQEERLAASNTPEHKSSLDQDAFLTILVAQLTHQDPLNPMEDTEMTSQLAQFSSLEQLTNINKGITALNDSKSQNDMLAAVSFIGKEVKAEGYKVSLSEGNASTIYYGFGESVSKIMMNIYDSEGAIVRTVELGSKDKGTYQYTWDGKNENGVLLPDGQYGVGILGEDVSGKHVMVQTEISGRVDAVVTENGTQYLRLSDGRFINFLNIKEVVDPEAESVIDTPETNEEDDTETT